MATRAQPRILLHIVDRDAWEADLVDGDQFTPEDLGAVGFTHLSTPSQVLIPANEFYRGRSGLVLLVIDPGALTSELRYEEGVPPVEGQRFPHLYGSIERSAVIDVVDFPCDETGRFSLPAALR